MGRAELAGGRRAGRRWSPRGRSLRPGGWMDGPQAGGSRHSAGLCSQPPAVPCAGCCSLVPGGQRPSGTGPGAASGGHRALSGPCGLRNLGATHCPDPRRSRALGRQTEAPPGAGAERGWGALPGSPRPSRARQHLWLVLRGCGSSPAECLPSAYSATRCDPARPAGSRHHRLPQLPADPGASPGANATASSALLRLDGPPRGLRGLAEPRVTCQPGTQLLRSLGAHVPAAGWGRCEGAQGRG